MVTETEAGRGWGGRGGAWGDIGVLALVGENVEEGEISFKGWVGKGEELS